MSELGRLLAETRAASNLSLADAESATRVRQKYLVALEQGNYAVLPPGAIARGFLRNYARYLGLNSAEALRLYAQESGDHSPVPPPSAGQVRAIDYRPLEVSLINENPGATSGWWRWLLAILLVAVVAAAIWWLRTNGGDPLRNTGDWLRSHIAAIRPGLAVAFGPQPTSTRTATATPARAAATITPPVAPAAAATGPALRSGAADSVLVPSPTSDLLTLPIPTTQPTVTPTPTAAPTATPEPTTGISLTVKITQRAWLKVTVDGNLASQELLEAGQERGWQANQTIALLTGNAAGVVVTINGQDLGAMGGVGQVLERAWTLNKEGAIAEGTPGPTAIPTKAP